MRFCVVLLSLFVAHGFSWSAYAQSSSISETSLESYMKNNEPAQKGLKPPAQESDDDSFLSRLQNAADEKERDQQDSKGDALPNIPTRVELQTEGFDYSAGRKIAVDVDVDNIDNIDTKSSAELEEEIRREAYDAAITGLFPMGRDQIKRLLLEYDATARVVESPVHGIPTPKITVATVSLDPGVTPLAIHTATGHVTTLNILDITGAPWPIQDISWAGDFEVTEPEEGGHIIRITPLSLEAYGNMSIRLLTLKTPVTITLRTSKDEVQYRVDARISEYGPFAQAPLIEGGTERVAGNSLIMSILDGTPPTGAVRLDVSGVDGRTRAYNINNMTYVRTPLTLLSPGWEQSVSSADGMNVYALNQTPILLLSDHGRFMRAGLKISKELLDE